MTDAADTPDTDEDLTRSLRWKAVLIAAFLVGPALMYGLGVQAFVLASGSMAPEMPTGSVVWTTPDDPQVGDVIAYRSVNDNIQVHRVIEVRDDGGETEYVTKGDANSGEDSFVVEESDVVGVVQAHLPYVGHIWLGMESHVFLVFTTLVASYVAVSLWARRLEDEEADDPGFTAVESGSE